MFKLTEWEKLRWAATTSQLKKTANKFNIPIDDIPKTTKRKEGLATRIAIHLGIPQDVSDFHDVKERIVECCSRIYGFGTLEQWEDMKNEEERTIRDICKMVKKP